MYFVYLFVHMFSLCLLLLWLFVFYARLVPFNCFIATQVPAARSCFVYKDRSVCTHIHIYIFMQSYSYANTRQLSIHSGRCGRRELIEMHFLYKYNCVCVLCGRSAPLLCLRHWNACFWFCCRRSFCCLFKKIKNKWHLNYFLLAHWYSTTVFMTL